MLSAVRKNGRMVSPDTVASSFTNAEKSIAVMLRAPHRRRHSTTEDRHVRQPPPRLVGPAAPCEVALPARAGRSKAGFMSIQSAVRTAMSGAAITLVATLVSIYIVSQFLRNSIGVIAPNLAADLDLSPAEIGLLSSIFFLTFAAVQIPLGMALDRFGPRICLVVGAAVTVIGAVVFACAANPAVLIFGR